MVSIDDPKLRVSATVLSVATLIVLPALPVPIFIVFALFPVPRLIDPVVPESRVKAFAPVELTKPAPVKLSTVPPTLKLFATPVTELRVGAS